MNFIVDNVTDTINIGKQCGEMARPGDIFCVNGDLGTGKTHFTKGFAQGLNINDHITSPTFTIVNEYSGRLKLYHFDVYRVNDPDEIYAIGFDEYIFSDGVSIIEWSVYINELIPEEHVEINISKIPEQGDNFRNISIEYIGNRYSYLDKLKE